MWVSVVILTIMWTVEKGIKISVILLTKILVLTTNLGPPTVGRSCTAAAVDTGKMKQEKSEGAQLQTSVSDGTTGSIDVGDDRIPSMESVSCK